MNDQSSPRTNSTTTRDRLIEVARDLFHRNGYAQTGIAAILDEAEVNSGSLYYFFPSKEDLLVAVLERYKEMLWPMVIQPAFDRVSDPIERVFAVLDGYRRLLIETGCKQGCPIGNLALEMSDEHPGVRALVAENFDGWCAAIEQCFEAARDRLPPGTDTARLSRFVLTVMEGGVMQARAERQLVRFEEGVAQLRDYIDILLAQGGGWNEHQEGDST